MILRMFGIGTANAMAGGQTEGTVTMVKTCWWFRVNTKPVRRFSGDGAIYPHILSIAYQANGQTYTAKRWVNWNKRCPVKGEKMTVYYEQQSPEKYAVIV